MIRSTFAQAVLAAMWLAGLPSLALAAGDGKPDPIGKQLQADTAIWTAVVFLGLLFILWKFAWGPISEGLQKREDGIAGEIAEAKRQNEEARRLLADYEKKLEHAAGEVREIMDEARRDADHTKDDILASARKDAQRERDRAIREIEIAKQAALKDLGEKSVNLAVDLAGKIVATQLSQEDHARMVQDAVSRFAQADPSRN